MVVGVQQIAVHDNATCQSTPIYVYPDYVNRTVGITPGTGNIHFPAGSLTVKNFGPSSALATLRLTDYAGNILYEEPPTLLNANQTLSNSRPIYLDMPMQDVILYLVAGEYVDTTFQMMDAIYFMLTPLGVCILTVQSTPVSAQFQKDSATYTTPHSQKVAAGTTVTVTAATYTTDQAGKVYKFDHWENGSTNPTRIITVNTDTTVTAYYIEAPTYTLTISVEPAGGGRTTPPPGVYNYPEGSTVTVTATPASGYKFDHWELDGQVRTENPTTITMNRDYTLTAYFKLVPTHTLTINVNDPTMGTTNPAPGTYTYPEGSTVKVQAIPYTGYRFKNWTLDTTTSTENPITVYMDKDYTLTANFEPAPAPQYATLTGTVTGLFGKPVSGATISLNNLYRTTTDAAGRYTIQNITPGTYTLTASHPLYETKVITVSLPQPTTYTVNITLQIKRIYIIGGVGALSAIIVATLWAAVRK
jgi:uncharacterized repeat protein (TIGR02543 family)